MRLGTLLFLIGAAFTAWSFWWKGVHAHVLPCAYCRSHHRRRCRQSPAIPVIALLTYLCCVITTKLLSFLPGSRYFVGV
ncbi:MAG: hypothetical protein J6W88_03535 [Bacteroidales bacterium]|nr:hypothetical protein [Bacteroidales bacterium]